MVTPGYYLLESEIPGFTEKFTPGQFVMVSIPGGEVFLRRPFSIYDCEEGRLKILYKVAGRGTGILSGKKKGETLEILGPLGNGFSVKQKEHHVVVAGGIGLAGVHALLRSLQDRKASLFFGCSNKSELALLREMSTGRTHVSTIDGSCGKQGTVTELLAGFLPKEGGRTEVYACGPRGMIKSLKECLSEGKIGCQVLLEERMACGLGLCFGCVTRTLDENEPYKRICKEGPVFDLWELYL